MVWLPCFISKEIETKSGETTCIRLHSYKCAWPRFVKPPAQCFASSGSKFRCSSDYTPHTPSPSPSPSLPAYKCTKSCLTLTFLEQHHSGASMDPHWGFSITEPGRIIKLTFALGNKLPQLLIHKQYPLKAYNIIKWQISQPWRFMRS